MGFRIIALCGALGLAALTGWTAPASAAGPLDTWSVSCGADKGAITRKGRTWTFRTSRNHCPGGIFKQRAEISTRKVQPNHAGSYLFESRIAMKTARRDRFSVFQIHDGRHGCAPPLMVNVMPSGQIELTSDVKTGPGESCIRGKLGTSRSRRTILRDGTVHLLRVLITFDGRGGFAATVWVDGNMHVSGTFRPSDKPAAEAHRPKFFYFKHGVYTQHVFAYVMTSENMRVRRVKLAN